MTKKQLLKAGWKQVGDKFVDPVSRRRFTLAQALFALEYAQQQADLVEETKQVVEDNITTNFYQAHDEEYDVDLIWPKYGAAHKRLVYCTFYFGCSYHTQLVKCEDHHHFRIPSNKRVVCNGQIPKLPRVKEKNNERS